MNHQILRPLFAQVALTFLVWCWLFICRLRELIRTRAKMQELTDEQKFNQIFKNAADPSDNFENLFEMPIFFMAIVILIDYLNLTDHVYLYGAYIFVGTRAIHSFIHCTYNRVIDRFIFYFLGSLILWGMWVRLALQLSGT